MRLFHNARRQSISGTGDQLASAENRERNGGGGGIRGEREVARQAVREGDSGIENIIYETEEKKKTKK